MCLRDRVRVRVCFLEAFLQFQAWAFYEEVYSLGFYYLRLREIVFSWPFFSGASGQAGEKLFYYFNDAPGCVVVELYFHLFRITL